MKNKIFMASAVVLFMTTMVSCKKDYVCKCSKTYTSGSGGTNTDNHSQYTFKDNRKRAEDRCNEQESTGSDLFGNYSIDCQIQ